MLPGGVAGAPYVAGLHGSGGSEPYTFSLVSGSLPPGLTLHSEGLLNGTPTAIGSFPVLLALTSAAMPATAVSGAFTITVEPPLVFSGYSLANGRVGQAYQTQLQIEGGVAPYQVVLAQGTLPGGVTLSGNGMLAGTPITAGTTDFSVQVTDSGSPTQAITGHFAMNITAAPLVLSYAPAEPVRLGESVTLSASLKGGTAPYSFTLSAGALPRGLTLQGNGIVSGVTAGSGIFPFSITATDGAAQVQTSHADVTLSVFDTLVQANAAKVLAIVPATAYGLHTSVYDNELSDTAALATLVPRTGVTLLRYPGGSYADRYHWAQYTTTPAFHSDAVCGVVASGYLAAGAHFGSFVKTLSATGTQAIITVNYGTSVANAAGSRSEATGGGATAAASCSEPNTGGQPQEAAAWVAYANGVAADLHVIGKDAVGFDWKTTGYWAALREAVPLAVDDGYNFLRISRSPIGVRYWEIGNEVYYNGFGLIAVETDLHAPYSYAAGSAKPVARVDTEALAPKMYGANAASYVKAMRAVDPSIKIGLVLSANTVDPVPLSWNPAVLRSFCARNDFDFAAEHYYPGDYNAVTAQELFLSPQVNMPAIVSQTRAAISQACPQLDSEIPIFLTETNANGTLATGTPAEVIGLFAAHEFLSAFEAGIANVEWLELHDQMNTYLSAAEAPGPAYYSLEMAHRVAGVGAKLIGSTSTNPGILVHAAAKFDNSMAVMLINTGSAAATVKVDGLQLGSSATVVSYGVGTVQEGPDLPEMTTPVQANSLVVTVPASVALAITTGP